MRKIKNLYNIVAKGARSGKEAYEMVNDHIIAYASNLLKERHIADEILNEILDEEICLKLFNGNFDDYGCLTEEEANTYVSNIVDNEIILANYRKRQDEIMFK